MPRDEIAARSARGNDKLMVEFAEGQATSLAKLVNKRGSWASFCARCAEPERTRERYAQYLKLDADQQAVLKLRPGWFTPATYKGKRRKRTEIRTFQLVTLDCDDISPELLAEIMDPTSFHPFQDYEWVLYTTRKHGPDKPRVRIVLPLMVPINPDAYVATVRFIASILDPAMETVDPVSFRPAQLMYWSSCSVDSEFIFHRNAGEVLNANEFLEAREGWQDLANLPKGANEKVAHSSADKAEDPWEKEGMIGDFCRAWPVEDAIKHFLPDCYAPGDGHEDGNPRYTYLKGSAANGAVVYDDGRFLYSWHGTDPAGEQLVNAFDLVRLHKFGNADADDHRENPPPKTLPSFKEMTAFIGKDQKTLDDGLSRRLDVLDLFEVEDDDEADDDAGDGHGGAAKAKPVEDLSDHRVILEGRDREKRKPRKKSPKNWKKEKLARKPNGDIARSTQNQHRILTYDERLVDRLVWDEINQRPAVRYPIKIRNASDDITAVTVPNPRGKKFMSPLEDHDFLRLKALLGYESPTGGYGLGNIPEPEFKMALGLTCANNPVDAVRDFCDAVDGEWDGIERTRTMFARDFGEDQNDYTAEAGELLMIGIVARAYEPGHKWDYMPILEGAQGQGKSTYMNAIVGSEWTGELTHGFEDTNKVVEQTMGKVLVEVPELSAMKASQIDRIKEMITIQIDTTRLAYGLSPKEYARRVIFVGTTNKTTYLSDPTGSRRFWPIKVNRRHIDHVEIAKERRQRWAEAVHKFKALRAKHPDLDSVPLMLSEEATVIWERRCKAATVDDIRGERHAQISHFLATPVPLSLLDGPGFAEKGEPMVVRTKTCTAEIMERVLTTASGRDFRAIGMTIAEVDGWKKYGGVLRVHGINRKAPYVREDATIVELRQGYRIVGKYKGPETDDDGLEPNDLL